MDPIYDSYFQGRIEEIGFRPGRREGITFRTRASFEANQAVTAQAFAIVQVAVYSARQVLEGVASLRSDGELCLYLAFSELVARPLLVGQRVEPSELSDAVVADVVLVVRRATEWAVGGEISAHAVVNAVSGSWDDMRTSRFQLWDND